MITPPSVQIWLLLAALWPLWGDVPETLPASEPAVEVATHVAVPADAASPADVPGPAEVRTAEEAPTAAGPVVQEPEEILRATARAYEGLHSVRAEFEQLLENKLLGRTTTSSGVLYQEEPDKFLMDFNDPDGDVIVSDGRYFWMYFPSVDEKQVIRTPRRARGLDLQAQFIGDPVARFDYTYHGTETVRGRATHVMTLVPRQPAGYERMKVWIDQDDHVVRRFELLEENGNVRHLELMDVTVNPTLPDSLFEFTPPEDAIVVDQG